MTGFSIAKEVKSYNYATRGHSRYSRYRYGSIRSSARVENWHD